MVRVRVRLRLELGHVRFGLGLRLAKIEMVFYSLVGALLHYL